jgi:hypothetical protein
MPYVVAELKVVRAERTRLTLSASDACTENFATMTMTAITTIHPPLNPRYRGACEAGDNAVFFLLEALP